MKLYRAKKAIAAFQLQHWNLGETANTSLKMHIKQQSIHCREASRGTCLQGYPGARRAFFMPPMKWSYSVSVKGRGRMKKKPLLHRGYHAPTHTCFTNFDRGGIIPVQDGILTSSPISAYEVKQGSDDWYDLRQGRLTASSFSTALGFWGVSRRVELWEEKVGLRERFAGNPATEWGSSQEAPAVEKYQKLTGNIVQSLGFKIYKEGDDVQGWIGASPDGLIDESICGVYEKAGILEVKCPHNKGKPELCVPWDSVPYYYMPQVQGLMEVLDRDWLDLYVWTLNGSSIFRVERNTQYWALIYGVLSDFWWVNVVPAKQTLLLQKNVDVNIYRPVHLHRLTSVIMKESRTLATKAPLVWKEPNRLH